MQGTHTSRNAYPARAGFPTAVIVGVFASTLFISASLLFAIQPMFAKLLLPLLGGTPAVWATCMVFFQAALLAGYLYVHVATRYLEIRWQVLLHIVLLAASVAFLPVALPNGWSPPPAENPIPEITAVLLVAIGAPFALLSATAPMLQKWFSQMSHRDAADPYFLYVPSNVGSLVALASYPFLIEPNLGLVEQRTAWSVGYILFAGLLLACTLTLWLNRRTRDIELTDVDRPTAPVTAMPSPGMSDVTWLLRLRWILLAFAPSSLLLGVTTYLTTDIAAVPLFWVVPLGLYLLTFILVFARRQLLPHGMMTSIMPFAILPVVQLILWGLVGTAWLNFTLHLGAFFVAAMVCHGELVRLRPHTESLTEFYLCMSVGGVLGGIFNAVIAPLAFDLLIEYSIALALVCYLKPGKERDHGLQARILDVVLPVALGGALIWAIVPNSYAEEYAGWITITILAAMLGLAWSERRVRFSLWIWALLVAAPLYAQRVGSVIFLDRSFFGVSRVVDFDDGSRGFYHGTTLHGTQSLDPRYRLEPTTYFTRSGPFGDIAGAFLDRRAGQEVVVMGLGVGTLACYGHSGDSWHFLEIDPMVADIAGNPQLFTYLSDCPPNSEIVLGDARLTIAGMPDGRFDLMIADAFSSDAVPVHLLTREAVELYLTKIKPGGAIAFHITNRYVDLEPVLADLAQNLGIVAYIRSDDDISADDRSRYDKRYAVWVVAGRSERDMARLREHPGWQPLSVQSNVRYWTDDFSNIVTVLR
jgi:hypothetical protein